MSNRAEVFEQANLRMECVVDIASLIGSGSFERQFLPDNLDDFCCNECDPRVIHKSALEIMRIIDNEGEDREAFVVGEALLQSGKTGLLVKFATPVRKWVKGRDAYSASWGRYYTGWVYADTYEKAVELGLEWAQAIAADDKAQNT